MTTQQMIKDRENTLSITLDNRTDENWEQDGTDPIPWNWANGLEQMESKKGLTLVIQRLEDGTRTIAVGYEGDAAIAYSAPKGAWDNDAAAEAAMKEVANLCDLYGIDLSDLMD